MQALAFFTTFGSAEFAIREFLRRDPQRTLAVMETWSRDDNEHLRRLASEGSRPRLPWSFHLDALIADPTLAAPILENLKADSSPYVRKSVANHLNDITKDHPGWVLDRIESWSLESRQTAWIAKHSLRTLIKKGDRRALGVIGAGAKAQVLVKEFSVHPRKIVLGEKLTLSLTMESTASKSQRLVVDYVVHYVKKSGAYTQGFQVEGIHTRCARIDTDDPLADASRLHHTRALFGPARGGDPDQRRKAGQGFFPAFAMKHRKRNSCFFCDAMKRCFPRTKTACQ